MRVLAVASEIFPIIKTGGLADVVGALPPELRLHDIEVRTLIPGYPEVIQALPLAEELLRVPSFFGGPVRLLSGSHAGLDLIVLDAPHLFARPGNPYVSADGKDWPDNALRFSALSRAAAEIGLGAVPSFVPSVVHCHDWQAGLTSAYLNYARGPHPATVMTIHNLAYQGLFAHEMLEVIGLPVESFTIDGVEFYGKIGFLKAGLQYSNRISTVSPTYAREILEDDGGMGLGGLLRKRSDVLSGILNGIDIAVWNPETDPYIAAPYSMHQIASRALNKTALQQRCGLDSSPNTLLLGVVSRLTWQKGLDLLLETMPTVLEQNMQLVVLGNGDSDLQQRYQAVAREHPGRVSVTIGYDEAFAHLIQAGSDALLVPSRFEPCGLTQLCALRYGAIPVVAQVGGLSDTVIDAKEVGLDDGIANGFTFAPVTAERLAEALHRVIKLWRNQHAWRHLQRNAMSKDVSWSNRASRYAELYRQVVADIRR